LGQGRLTPVRVCRDLLNAGQGWDSIKRGCNIYSRRIVSKVMEKETMRYLYIFTFPDGTEKQFEIVLDATTLEFTPPADRPKPAWTKLKYCQCSNCPLGDEVEYCPVAVNLSTVVETFKDRTSHESTVVSVEAGQRTYQKEIPLQRGLSSIAGMRMVTSNCPILDQLRPNVRFHLPFASSEEKVYRQVAMYLTQQYFIMRRGGKPDWDLSKLKEIYREVLLVNKGLAERLTKSSSRDANVNAIIILASFGQFLDDYLETSLQEIEPYFRRP